MFERCTILYLIVAFMVCSTAVALEQSLIWDSLEGGYESIHVHGLVRATNGDLLAFSEGRIQVSDTGAHDLIMKRSSDGGATWSNNIVIVPAAGRSLTNPTPVMDSGSGKLFLFYAENHGNESTTSYYISSTDHGDTWTSPVGVNALFDNDPENRPFHLPGPGHGIETSSGRLLVQFWHRFGLNGNPSIDQRKYSVSIIYSDDGGQSWMSGGYVPLGEHMNESRIYEAKNGDIIVNARKAQGGSSGRGLSRSTDGGLTWSAPFTDTSLGQYVAIDSGFTRISSAPGAPLAASRPDSTARENMTLSLSYDDGMNWHFDTVLEPDSAYYSDIVDLGNGVIGVLYGAGNDAPGGYSTVVASEVRFARISVQEMAESQSPQATVTNGDFEDLSGWGAAGDPAGTQPAGWRTATSSPARRNAASLQTGAHAIGGSGISAFLPADAGASGSDRREIAQVFSSPLPKQWSLRFDFASEDPGGGSNRSLSGSLLFAGSETAFMTFRIVDTDDDGDGDFQLYNGSSWVSIPALKDAIQFDPDVSTSPQTHSLTLAANWSSQSAIDAGLTVTIVDSYGATHQASGLNLYQTTISTTAEVGGMGLNTFLSSGDYLVDNVLSEDELTPTFSGLRIQTIDGVLVLAWPSADGKTHSLRFSTTLENPPPSWPVFTSHENLPSTPPINTLAIPWPNSERAFFIVEETTH